VDMVLKTASFGLNCEDLPEVRCVKINNVKLRYGKRAARAYAALPAYFQPVFEEEEDDEEEPQEQTQVDVEAESWPCSFCTFLNAAQLPDCEMCGLPRRSIAHQVATVDPQPTLSPCSVYKSGAIAGLRKWPSLQQASQRSWEICEQSSTTSSMLDVGRMADLQGPSEHGSAPFEMILGIGLEQTEGLDCVSKDRSLDETSSMVSWCRVEAPHGQGDGSSVASSWLDVGNLADVEGASTNAPPEWQHRSGFAVPQGQVKRGGATAWSTVASAAAVATPVGMATCPRCPKAPMPPWVHRQAPQKQKQKPAPIEEEDDDFYDDQDGRGRPRCNRRFHRCR